ncbi:RagB/SusD family nutrient uptake outer membrane protein [uncultured Marivirga sp.]|uniref:RagB/SusD family nutrient uptake outer membrane protein n=1 Tax=uncultured Marivirga sp. TaxID=1123707 RepID=UPI0030ECDE3F|tara:strand:+ start:68577 stop:69998 length:1422 start_codon:yes stop_codon:yes gene_type:complete
MKLFNIKLFALIVGTVFLLSCEEDPLELQPAQSLSTEEAISDLEGLQAALNGAYDGLQLLSYYGRNFPVMWEAHGDNVYISTRNSNRFLNNYQYQNNSFSGDVSGLWADGYSTILRANNIINAEIESTDQAAVNQAVGEAYAIRALVHFDLVRSYALPYSEGGGSQPGVPYITEAFIGEPARDAVSVVYENIIADLTQAKSLMTDGSVGPVRFTGSAVDALLARVYLYRATGDDLATAYSLANSVRAQYGMAAGADLVDFWDSSENDSEIFTLKFVGNESRGANNFGYIYIDQSIGYGDIRVSSDIINLYEAGDPRLDLIYEVGGEFYVGKFLGESASGIPGLVSPKIIRNSEMYMIAAEAAARRDDFANARTILNEFRAFRGLAALTTTDVPNNGLLDEIMEERRREFAFEGHRSFDLFRLGRGLTRNQCGTGLEITAPCSISSGSPLRIFPIPQNELDVNENMVQNAGYAE